MLLLCKNRYSCESFQFMHFKMSVQGSQKMRKSSTLSGSKQGPLKAILPVSSFIRKESHLKKSKSNSPMSSLKSHFSPESGQRSPGSISYKGVKCVSPSCKSDCLGGYIRRTASLDAIYLKCHWPKDSFAMNSIVLKVDKATQTEEVGSEKKCRHMDFGNDDMKYEKYIRHRLQKANKDAQNGQKLGLRLVSPSLQNEYSSEGSQTPPGFVLPNLIRSGPESPIQGFPVNIAMKTSLGRALMRNSIEGLNQEIERLVLRDIDDKLSNCSSIPEGHRAPLADILRQTRSVNTQTPGNDEIEGDFAASDPPSRDSGSPMVCGNMDLSTPPNYFHGSRGSSPDDFNKFGTSPHINKFLGGEPPDGCEKPLSTTFQFKPSLGSAFHPLHSNHSGLRCHSMYSTGFNGDNSAEDSGNGNQASSVNSSSLSGVKTQND